MNGPSTLLPAAVSAPQPIDAVRLGELDSGTVAIARRGAAVVVGDTTVSWWIGAEDRWHRPSLEPSTRDRLVDGTPVVESSVRIPSGDAVGRVTVARVDGVPRPSVVIDVENASPIPVAFAYIVESSRRLELLDQGVAVDGDGVLTLTRPPLGWAVAATADELVEVLEAGAMTAAVPPWDGPGIVAVLVPLPHTAHAVATFTPGLAADDVATRAALSDRSSIPDPARVVAGWDAHAGTGARLEFGDARHRTVYRAAVCDVLLGTDVDDAVVEALVATALGRLGRVDDAGPLADVLDRQRSNGSLPGPDPVAGTLQLVAAVSAWWAGGGSRLVLDDCLGPLAAAAAWLDKRRQRDAVSALGGRAGSVLGAAAATLVELGQPEVAAAVRAHADRIGSFPAPPALTVPALVSSRGDGLSWADLGGQTPDVGTSAAFVIAALDGAVADDGRSLALVPAWDPTRAGEPFEAHDVATRAGRLSYGIRWHGERPAILWELTPWPDRPVPASFRLTAPAIDPTWSSTEPVGEALLAAPVGVPTPETPSPSDPPAPRTAPAVPSDTPATDGGSFS